ncbi:MAG TPA: hypothetical protein VM581_04385, partial [Magnetospirillaceae bacterium]|nr:hypothetical protein [Magnetospirillaceae bacterium]
QQFTIDKTLPELQSHFHQAQLVLLCGSDVVRTLSTRWPGVEILFTQTELVVGVREGESRIDLKALLEALPVQPRVTFVEGPHAQVSATEVRAGNLFATDPLVREYIQTNRLYQPA